MLDYKSSFVPSESAERVLRTGRILAEHESPADMVSRVANTLGEQEFAFTDDPERAAQFVSDFGSALDRQEIIMSTPVMTNAGRYTERPLTACTVPTTSLDPESKKLLREEIISLHEQGMGTGFNLDDTKQPDETLRFLNMVAVESANSGREDRPVGNMAVLNVRHPKIDDFINVKKDAPARGEKWKFNISVDLDDEFMEQLELDGVITLRDGQQRKAREIFQEICEAATVCADPGIIFLDRMNDRNPVPGLGSYKTTAPCAEVGLIEGETCQFGYINMGKFVSLGSTGPAIDFDRLEQTTILMTTALDNSLEISQDNLDGDEIRHMSSQKRKIGIGLCGVADAISLAGLPYDSPEARTLMQDALSFINFVSKKASMKLAEERGSFGAMSMSDGNRHLEEPGHLEHLYGNISTNAVSAEEWRDLSERIRETKMLRNSSTVALPPTGRSALIIDASTGIEPHFDTLQANPAVLSSLANLLRAQYGADLYDPQTHTPEVARIVASAHSIEPLGHIAMVAALQRLTDEAISKTINLPAGSSPDDVAAVYKEGYQAGMSGVTIYVDQSHGTTQPKQVR